MRPAAAVSSRAAPAPTDPRATLTRARSRFAKRHTGLLPARPAVSTNHCLPRPPACRAWNSICRDLSLVYSPRTGPRTLFGGGHRKVFVGQFDMLRFLALAAAAASAQAFVAPGAGRVQGSTRGITASRPSLCGARALRAVYEPALRIGHGFDIHRLGEPACRRKWAGYAHARMHTGLSLPARGAVASRACRPL